MNQYKKESRPIVAGYEYWDLPHTRVHHWTPSDKWAVGWGPIEYVSEAKARELLSHAGNT